METIIVIVSLISSFMNDEIFPFSCLALFGCILVFWSARAIKQRKRVQKAVKQVKKEEEKIRLELAKKDLYFFIQNGEVLDQDGNVPQLLGEYPWKCPLSLNKCSTPDKAVKVCFSHLRYAPKKDEIILKPENSRVFFKVLSLEKDGHVVLEHPIMGILKIWNKEKRAKKRGQRIMVRQCNDPVGDKYYSFFRIPSYERSRS